MGWCRRILQWARRGRGPGRPACMPMGALTGLSIRWCIWRGRRRLLAGLCWGRGFVWCRNVIPSGWAKEVATLDLVSGGRFLFGIGAGWLQGEAEVLGSDFPRRWAQTREYVAAMKALWTEAAPEFHGRWVDFPPVICEPKPAQRPHPPVLVGGELRRAAQRVADYGDGWLPRARNTSEYSDPGKLPGARRHIEELYRANGRDPSALKIVMWDAPPDREQKRRFFDAGADHIVHLLTTGGERATLEALEQVAEAALG